MYNFSVWIDAQINEIDGNCGLYSLNKGVSCNNSNTGDKSEATIAVFTSAAVNEITMAARDPYRKLEQTFSSFTTVLEMVNPIQGHLFWLTLQGHPPFFGHIVPEESFWL